MYLIINSELGLVSKIKGLKSETWDFSNILVTAFDNYYDLCSVSFLYLLYKLVSILSIKTFRSICLFIKKYFDYNYLNIVI